jgi:microcompartment protein CcmL/EutN
MKRTMVNPHWTNNARTTIAVEFRYEDGRVVKAAISESDTSNPDLAELKAKYTTAQIEENTKKQIAIKNELDNRKNIETQAALEKKKQEDLFAVKLEVFEIEAIKNSTNRLLKSKIRKSKSPLEAHAYAAALLLDEHNKSITDTPTANT